MGVLSRLRDDLVNGFVSILKGHGITWRNMWRERVTIQYPKERPVLPERYRGLPGINPELCIVCGACGKACPVQIITMKGEKIEGTKQRRLVEARIEAGRCMFCGLCEEACPVKGVTAIRMSNVFELASGNKRALVLELPELQEIWKSKPIDVPMEELLANAPRALAERELAKKAAASADAASADPGDAAPAKPAPRPKPAPKAVAGDAGELPAGGNGVRKAVAPALPAEPVGEAPAEAAAKEEKA